MKKILSEETSRPVTTSVKQGASDETKDAVRTRRKPRQQRGLATVDAIMDCACLLFKKHGYQKVTTNHIADKAGVSIGSLYQYFEDKDSISGALMERASRRLKYEIENFVRANPLAAMDEDVYKVLEMILRFYEGNRFVLLDLVDENPELHKLQELLYPERIGLFAFYNLREKHAARLKSQSGVWGRMFVQTHAFHAMRSFLRYPPAEVSREELLNSLTNLFILYETNPHVDYSIKFGRES